MLEFLNDESVRAHEEYLRNLSLRYSILKKSIKCLDGLNVRDIQRQNIKKQDKEDAIYLLGEIEIHRLFFASFGAERYRPCPIAEKCFGSVSAMLNVMYREGCHLPYGYVALCDDGGRLTVRSGVRGYELYLASHPILAIDVSEHSYFSDYGFDKESYLYKALPHLLLDKIVKFYENR